MNRTALILAAYGSRHSPMANAIVCRHARAIAQLRLFDEVEAAFYRGRPSFASVLDHVQADDVTVVPVMTSSGLFCDVVLSRELAKNRRFSNIRLRISRPVGTHPDMAPLVADRVKRTLQGHDLRPDQTALAIVGHGTERHPHSRRATERLAAVLQDRRLCARVRPFFLDQEPTVEEIYSSLPQDNIIVVPFLIGGGQHGTQDVPTRLGIQGPGRQVLPVSRFVHGRLVVCDDPVGTDPRLAEIILERALGKSADAGASAVCRVPHLPQPTQGHHPASWPPPRPGGQVLVHGP